MPPISDITDCIISTHDLTRRSTGRNRSRSRKEIFQLTTSQGGRLHRLSDRLLLHYFNSRPRKEVDTTFKSQNLAMCGISTHDLARRSTVKIDVRGKATNTFQLTTSQGGRLAGKSCIVGMLAFQLTTSQGGRRL